jgi:hypothetical protein
MKFLSPQEVRRRREASRDEEAQILKDFNQFFIDLEKNAKRRSSK